MTTDAKLDGRVAELDALAEKATPGEWSQSGAHLNAGHDSYVVAKRTNCHANAKFIRALLNAWRTWLRDAALRGLENPKAAGSEAAVCEKCGMSGERRCALCALAPLAAEWVMVPREPTEKMCKAGAATGMFDHDFPNYNAPMEARAVWCSMLAAAPRGAKD